MAAPTRSTISKVSQAKRSAVKTPVTPGSPAPAPSGWGEARIVLILLFGLFAMLLCTQMILSDAESETLGTFLRGQLGWSSDALNSVLFWKMTVAFLLGAGGGYLAGLEIPRNLVAGAKWVGRIVGIMMLTLVVYIPAMTAGFLWDDDQEITANPSLQTNYGLWEIWTGGITYDKEEETDPVVKASKPNDPALVKALRIPLRKVEKIFWPETKFKTHESADYFPLKTTMLWFEYHLWGRNPDGNTNMYTDHQVNPFHVMNIILHALDALLLWMLLSQLRVPGAWLAGLLFAIHPVHVESVAWIAERKNTLSLLFYLLSISAWIKFENTWKKEHSDTSAWWFSQWNLRFWQWNWRFWQSKWWGLHWVGQWICRWTWRVLQEVWQVLQEVWQCLQWICRGLQRNWKFWQWNWRFWQWKWLWGKHRLRLGKSLGI